MYQRALNIDPTHIVSLCNLGLLLHDVRREYDEALAVFDQAMEAASDADDILVHHLASAHNKAGSTRPDPKAIALPPIFPHQDAHQGVLKTEMDALRQRQSSHYLSHLSTILTDKEQQKSERPADAAPPAESSPAAQARPGGPDAAAGGEAADKTTAHEAAAEDGQQGGGEGGGGGGEGVAAAAAEASAGADGSKAGAGAPKFVGTLLRQQQRQREEELKNKQVLVTAMILKSATLPLRAVGVPALPSARRPPHPFPLLL
jgi:tetratricopeptide (TPR) repeat protein